MRTAPTLACAAVLLLSACGGDGGGDGSDAASTDPDSPVVPVDATSDLPPCAELFVEGRDTAELLEAIPTDAQGFQVCADGQITVQFATQTSFCVNDTSRSIRYNAFGYGFADGTWVNVPENTPVGTGLPSC